MSNGPQARPRARKDVAQPSYAKMSQIQATVIRADGTREDLGTISYWHRNPLRRWRFALAQRLKRRPPGRATGSYVSRTSPQLAYTPAKPEE